MTPGEAAAVKERACTSKHLYTDPALALADARKLSRKQGEAIRHYPCPFHHSEPTWHVGHVPSLRSMEDLAMAIRGESYPEVLQRAAGPR